MPLLSLAIIIPAIILGAIYLSKYRAKRATFLRCRAAGKKVAEWLNLPKEEWKASFLKPETKMLIEEGIASYENIGIRYPKDRTEKIERYIEMMKTMKSWYELVETLEDAKNRLEKVPQILRQIYRLNCEVSIRGAIAMSEIVAKKNPHIRFEWYREVLMDYYYAIVENRSPPEEKDIH